MFLIAVVSIVEGMSRYMENDFVGRLMGINTFELRRLPNINVGNVTDDEWRAWQRRPRIKISDIEPITSVLPVGTRWATESSDNVQAESPFASSENCRADDRRRLLRDQEAEARQWAALRSAGNRRGGASARHWRRGGEALLY